MRPLGPSATIAISRADIRPAWPSVSMYVPARFAPVRTHENVARPDFVPSFKRFSSDFVKGPVKTSKRYPSEALRSTVGLTQAFLPSFVDSMKDEIKGTIAP